MAATTVTPVLNWINCLCCAGIMGGAVVATWMYKRNFPPSMPFSVGDGATIGVLSGLFGAVLNSMLSALLLGVSSHNMSAAFDEKFDEALRRMESTGQDVQAFNHVRDLVLQVAQSPILLFLIILAFSLLLFAAFGVLGGLIGGSIFKTRTVPVVPPSQQSGPAV